MNALARFFIRRPVAATMLAISIVLAGLLALRMLPVAPLPRVDFPVIQVRASLPGASPESMASTVAAPLERALGSIAGVISIRRGIPRCPPTAVGRLPLLRPAGLWPGRVINWLLPHDEPGLVREVFHDR